MVSTKACARTFGVLMSMIAVAEPPSQRSSRGPSPVNEQSYDALEGQFSPGQGKTAAFQATPFIHFHLPSRLSLSFAFIFLPG